MRRVGARKEAEIVYNASAEKLREGALFNDEMQKIMPQPAGFITKGAYHFKTHEEANSHWDKSLANLVSNYGKKRFTPGNF